METIYLLHLITASAEHLKLGNTIGAKCNTLEHGKFLIPARPVIPAGIRKSPICNQLHLTHIAVRMSRPEVKSLIIVRFAKCWRRIRVLRGCGGVDSASYPLGKYRRQNTPAHSALRRALFASVSQSRLVMELRQAAWCFAQKTLSLAWPETVSGADDGLSGNLASENHGHTNARQEVCEAFRRG